MPVTSAPSYSGNTVRRALCVSAAGPVLLPTPASSVLSPPSGWERRGRALLGVPGRGHPAPQVSAPKTSQCSQPHLRDAHLRAGDVRGASLCFSSIPAIPVLTQAPPTPPHGPCPQEKQAHTGVRQADGHTQTPMPFHPADLGLPASYPGSHVPLVTHDAAPDSQVPYCQPGAGGGGQRGIWDGKPVFGRCPKLQPRPGLGSGSGWERGL